MARLTTIQNSFMHGEISPLLAGRFDVPALYNNACSTLENFIVYSQGGVRRRTGTRFVAETDFPDQKVRLIPFEFSETEAYILEFCDETIRFYTDGGIVTLSGVPYTIDSPYGSDDLSEIKYVQAADTYYLAHPNFPVQKLVRNDSTDWSIEEADFVNGPFQDENITDVTIASSATTGSVTLTASADLFNAFQEGAFFRLSNPLKKTKTVNSADDYTAAIELDKGDSVTVSALGATWSAIITVEKSIDEGATWTQIYVSSTNFAIQITELLNDDTFYRIGCGTGNFTSGSLLVSMTNLDAWGYVKIDEYNSTTSVTATVIRALPATTATKKWSEGAWSAYRGYPAAIAFFEQRLVLAGSDYEPQDIWASKINDYENFKTGLLDNAAYNFTLVSNALNKILWLLENRVLHAGTLGGEWKFGYPDEPTTPTTVDAKNQTSDGSANIQAMVINNNVIFIEKGDRVLRSKVYDFNIDGYKSIDISLKAEHLLAEGISEMAFQKGVTPVIWMISADGNLIGSTYLPEQDMIAFHEHTTDGDFESVAVIPGANKDEVWVAVKRTTASGIVRYVEQMETEDWVDVDHSYYVDSAIQYDDGAKTTFSGAEHLEGLTCRVLADGAAVPDVTISGGSFELARPASVVTVGLGYDSVLETMPLVPPIEAGTSQGKNKALSKVTLQLKDTIGLYVGSAVDNVDEIYFRSSADPMDQGLPTFTGLKQIEYIKGFDLTQRIACVSNQALPCTILSISPVFMANPS